MSQSVPEDWPLISIGVSTATAGRSGGVDWGRAADPGGVELVREPAARLGSACTLL